MVGSNRPSEFYSGQGLGTASCLQLWSCLSPLVARGLSTANAMFAVGPSLVCIAVIATVSVLAVVMIPIMVVTLLSYYLSTSSGVSRVVGFPHLGCSFYSQSARERQACYGLPATVLRALSGCGNRAPATVPISIRPKSRLWQGSLPGGCLVWGLVNPAHALAFPLPDCRAQCGEACF